MKVHLIAGYLTLTTILLPAFAYQETPPGEDQQDPATQSVAEYRIGPRDVLSIDVFGLNDLDRKVRVLRDGSVSLPLLGSFQVSGLSPREAAAKIGKRLEDLQLVNDPQVSIFVEEYVSRSVSIQGAVQKPGVYPMIGNTTLLEMLSEAGGLLGRANERAGAEVVIVRRDTRGEQRRLVIDGSLLAQGEPRSNIFLEPGDIVLVPHAQRFKVYVTGAVRNPGPVEFLSSEGITVLQAVSAAGGPNERANQGKVHIVRRLPDGTQERINVDLKKIRKGKVADIALEKNDTVVVGEWFF